jgi:hypothetical protein
MSARVGQVPHTFGRMGRARCLASPCRVYFEPRISATFGIIDSATPLRYVRSLGAGWTEVQLPSGTHGFIPTSELIGVPGGISPGDTLTPQPGGPLVQPTPSPLTRAASPAGRPTHLFPIISGASGASGIGQAMPITVFTDTARAMAPAPAPPPPIEHPKKPPVDACTLARLAYADLFQARRAFARRDPLASRYVDRALVLVRTLRDACSAKPPQKADASDQADQTGQAMAVSAFSPTLRQQALTPRTFLTQRDVVPPPPKPFGGDAIVIAPYGVDVWNWVGPEWTRVGHVNQYETVFIDLLYLSPSQGPFVPIRFRTRGEGLALFLDADTGRPNFQKIGKP